MKDNIYKTALTAHIKNDNHIMDFDNCKVIDREQNLRKRHTLEALHIQTNDTCNFRRDTEKISSIYNTIINNKNTENNRT